MAWLNTPPFVTIIIPVYNEERYIRLTLESVLRLDYPQGRFEVIVVDNNSSDATPAIVRDIIRGNGACTLVTKVGGTIASVRNFGYRQTKGDSEVVAFLDGDTVVQPEWLKQGVELLSSGEVVCVGFAMAAPAAESHWVQKAWFDLGNSSRHRGTKQVNWLCSFNLILKKSAFCAVGGFNEALTTGEDFDLGVRLSTNGRILFSDATSVVHLGNVNNLPGFVAKEFWRGRGELYHLLMLRTKIKDSISTCISICYLLAFCSLVPAVVIHNVPLLLLSMVVIGLFPLVMLIRSRIFGLVGIIRGYAFYLFYFITRAVAAFVPASRR